MISCDTQNINRKIKDKKIIEIINPELNSAKILEMQMADYNIGTAFFKGNCGHLWINANYRNYEEVTKICNDTQIKYSGYTIYQCRGKMPTKNCEEDIINTIVISDKFSFNIELFGPAPPDKDCKRKFIPINECNESHPEKTGIELAKRLIDYLK
jgi:hypothetical protein